MNSRYEDFKKRIKKTLAFSGAVISLLLMGKCSYDKENNPEVTETPRPSFEQGVKETPNHSGTIFTQQPEIVDPPMTPDVLETVEPTPEASVEPSESVIETVRPTAKPRPSTRPTQTAKPTEGPGGIIIKPTPAPSESVKPTETPVPSRIPIVVPTSTPEVTVKPTETPRPTVTPTPTPAPTATPVPTPTPTPKPTQRPDRPDPDVPAHRHSFGSWYSLNDDLEERKCSCGVTETRAHNYNNIKTTYESTKDGSHYKVTTSTCSTCGHVKVEKDLTPCSYGELKWNSEYEYKVCEDCDYELKVKDHSLKTKEEIISNEDGTHTIKTTITCSTCGYKDSKEETLDCEYGDLGWDDTYEYHECEVCGYKKTIGKHNLGPATENVVGIVTYPCENDGCGYELEHKHIPGAKDTIYSDDTCHEVIVKCEECGAIISQDFVDHHYTTIEVGLTTKVEKCTGCGDEREVDLSPEEIEENLNAALSEETTNTVSYAYNHRLVRTRKKY